MMRCSMMLVMALGVASSGCSSEETIPTVPPDQEPVLWTPDADAPDADSTGARLWLEVDKSEDTVVVSLWGSELGDVFGWSAHVGAFDVGLPVVGAIVDERLGGADEASYLAAPKPGDVALGGTRRGADLGDVPLVDATRLAEVRLSPSAPWVSRLEIVRGIVRRSDGAFVPVSHGGGELDMRGGG